MPELNSSMISEVEYNAPLQRLAVTFRKTGKVYRNSVDVPQSIYDGLLAAASAGKYYNEVIKGKYGMGGGMSEPLIDPEQVNSAFLDCLYRSEEIVDGKQPDDAVIVEGILQKFGFHPQRLESHREQVTKWLLALPDQFLESKGGGWSFLNACNDRNDEQWTGLHQRMDQLFSLGIALGLAAYPLPRDMWDVLPGGMPYIIIKDKGFASATKSAERGQAMIESALVMVVFFLLIMGIFDFGQFFYFNQSLTDRLRAGARYGSIHNCGPDPSICVGAVNKAIYNDPVGGVPPLLAHLNDTGSAPGWVSASVGTHTVGTKLAVMTDNTEFITLTVHNYPVDLLLFPTFHRTGSVKVALEWERCYANCQ